MSLGRELRRGALIPAIAFVLVYAAARLALEFHGVASEVRVLFAIAPVPIFVWFLWMFIKMLRQEDELARRIQLEALAISFPSALVLLLILSLLEIAVELPKEEFGIKHVWYFLPILYFLGLAIARKRYQ